MPYTGLALARIFASIRAALSRARKHSASMGDTTRHSFMPVLATTGTPPSLITDPNGASQREAVNSRWHLNTVLPWARLLEYELTMKLESPVTLKFDTCALDRASRTQVVSKLAQAGVHIATALAAVGLDQTTHKTAFTSQPPIAKPSFSPEAQALTSPVRASICPFSMLVTSRARITLPGFAGGGGILKPV